MYNMMTNLYVFVIFMAMMIFELLITRLLDVSAALPWGITIGVYVMFVLFQGIVRINEDAEKAKIKNTLLDLMDAINGIPIINKNEKLIVKWDIVFKKLVDNKEFPLYDRIMKMKTQHIDVYINKYPSILIDDSVDLRESKYNMDLNSTIKGRNKKNQKQEEELSSDEECKKKLFIKEINLDTAVFSNYNASIYFDVILKHEHVPENAMENNVEPDKDYDGFSVWLSYQDKKYNVVPRVMVYKKNINKEKWFTDHINELLAAAQAVLEGDKEYNLFVDGFKLTEYLKDMPNAVTNTNFLKFTILKNELLVFSGFKDDAMITAYCELKTGYNRFEIVLKHYEKQEGQTLHKIESEKTVAIGNSFQPVVAVLEKMPALINNIELVIDNSDINNIVIS